MPKKYNYTKKTGRPSDYTEDTVRLAEEYIKKAKDTIKKIVISSSRKSGKKEYKYKNVVNLPKVEGLALHLGVRRETLYQWAKEHEDFSHILEKMNQIQANVVINKALTGEYNPLIAKLLLGKHGYKDQSKVEVEEKRVILDE